MMYMSDCGVHTHTHTLSLSLSQLGIAHPAHVSPACTTVSCMHKSMFSMLPAYVIVSAPCLRFQLGF